jgi:phosphonate transport system substrate-binding protein
VRVQKSSLTIAREGEVMKTFVKITLIFTLCLSIALSWATYNAFSEPKTVKMVVTAAFVSNNGIPVYDEMAKYFSKKLGWDVKVVSGLSYSEADEMLDKGLIQVGYVCGLPYVHKFAEKKYGLLAIPVMALKNGTWSDAKGYEDIPGKYYSYTIVRKDSAIKSWADLKGKTYAFNDKGSNSGYNVPRHKLVQLGVKSWEDYFSKVVVSGSHEESIRLVAEGVVDASSVDSLVLDYDRFIKDPNAAKVKIIEHLGPAGAPPVVISNKADPSIKKSFQDAILNMHKDPEGKKILEKALVLRFAPPADSNYNDIRNMEKAAKDAGFNDFGT